jgi:hypothetical protein
METKDSRLALCEVRGLLAQIIDVLSGKTGRYWFEVFKKVLRKENPFANRDWLVRTVRLGTYKEKSLLCSALIADGKKLGENALEMIYSADFVLSKKEKDIDVTLITPAELGFKEIATQEAIFNRAFELGLELCPAELGPQLRLQFTRQAEGDNSVFIAMEPIRMSSGYLKTFTLNHHDKALWLHGKSAYSHSTYGTGIQFVFCVRQ